MTCNAKHKFICNNHEKKDNWQESIARNNNGGVLDGVVHWRKVDRCGWLRYQKQINEDILEFMYVDNYLLQRRPYKYRERFGYGRLRISGNWELSQG